MHGTVSLSLLLLVVHHAHSSYVALAPSAFRPGWIFSIQLTVTDVPGGSSVTIIGDILNSKDESLAVGNITLGNGASGKLDILVNEDIVPDENNNYTLKLTGMGGLTFTNTTSIDIDLRTPIVLVQSDKGIYKPGQLVRYRVLTVDKDLIPFSFPKNITIEDPDRKALVQIFNNGSRAVFEGTFQISDFPNLGVWKIKVRSDELKLEKEIEFTVEECVLPKFEVSAKITPDYLLNSDKEKMSQMLVTVNIMATYTYGKGVTGDVKLTTDRQTIRGQITDPSGKVTMEIDLIKEMDGWGDITINVEVTDETQRAHSTQAIAKVFWNPVKVDLDEVHSDHVYHPGLPAAFVVRFTDPLGRNLGDEYSSGIVTLTLTDYNDKAVTQSTNIAYNPGQPVVWKTANIMSTNEIITMNASLSVNGKRYEQNLYIDKYETMGNATLDLSWGSYSSKLALGSSFTFHVAVSNPTHFSSLTYLIVSRGNIQEVGSASAGDTTLQVTTNMCPNGRLIVYGITATSATPEIIADSLNLKLEQCQNKKVTPSALVNTQNTGTETSITMQVSWTDPTKNEAIGKHSVYMVAVDKSILQLQKGNNLDPSEVDKKLEMFDLTSDTENNGPVPLLRGKRSIFPLGPMPGDRPLSTGELLNSVGLEIMSDAAIRKWIYFPGMVAFDNAPVPMMPTGMNKPMEMVENEMVDKDSGTSTMAADIVTVRKKFPDTWIWKSSETDDNGQLTVLETVPDTITSWIISGFAVSDNTEVALTDNPYELRAFNPFFVTLNLPYSIRRGEEFVLRATVFNYEESDMQVDVTLASSADFEISGNATHSIMVKRSSANSVYFTIEGTKIKTIDIQVTAVGRRSDGGSTHTDMVTRKLIVKPEGVEQMQAVTYPVILTSEKPSFSTELALNFAVWTEDSVVPGSRRAEVKVTADMMGNVVNNVDGLTTQPTGTGEENMITTVPNIYALAYLEAIGQATPEFKRKAKRYMISGYNREMSYYRCSPAGGYSAYGPNDESASTWLTAFVIKSFAQAKQFIPETVNMELLTMDINFLLSHQKKDGVFDETGRVLRETMQGGTIGALSVYVTMCLLEAQKYGFKIPTSNMESAIEHVKRVAMGEKVRKSQFIAAITAYTLALHNPDESEDVARLISYIQDNEAPWQKSDQSETSNEKVPYYNPPSRPSDIEVASYCILALVTIGDVLSAHDIVLWLQKQQNGFGGYTHTQDIVTALQALSEYSLKFTGTVPNTLVKITPLDPVAQAKTVTIDNSNKGLLQIVQLPDETNKVKIEVTGTVDSLAVVKVVWYFNTHANGITRR